MVSTRGVRYKFSEGERVLCYEPDPTKAKVLYDSKVLEVIESKDKRGRRTVEYLIHFQGWNSSWDRCVGEDFVLKDTEENRQLQRDLAEKSQLQLGAYLYRRERKKGGSTSGPASSAKRARHGFSDDGSSSPPPPDGGETGDTDSSSGEAVLYAPPQHISRAHIPLTNSIRERLTFDYHLVVKRGRLAKLPVVGPSVADILESFVKWYARAGAWHPQRGRHDPPHRPDLVDVYCRLNLMREVADGIRIYFDFVLGGHLLYRQEKAQYYEICGKYLDMNDIRDKKDMADEIDELLRSPKLPEYSHLPPDPYEYKTSGGGRDTKVTVSPRMKTSPDHSKHLEIVSEAGKEETEKGREREGGVEGGVAVTSQTSSPTTVAPSAPNAAPAAAKPKPVARAVGLARRLRSHKSLASHPDTEDIAPSTSTGEPREALSSSVGSSASSVSESWVLPANAPTTTTRTSLSLLLDKVAKWEIISREGTERLPCRLYGATHLARLFVKLPEFLGVSAMPDRKLRLIVKHMEVVIAYLEEHGEWFGDSYYEAEPTQKVR